MQSENQTWLRAFLGLGLVVLAAVIVVCIRLGLEPKLPDALPVAILEEAGNDTPSKSIEISKLLLNPASTKDWERLMEDRPDDVMEFIDGLEDREQASKLANEFVESVQGLHYDLLLNWLTRQKDMRIASLIFRGLIPRLIRENPDRSIALGFGLGESQDARVALDELFVALPLDRRVRLLNQQNPEERAWLLSQRATGFGERAPELCLEMIKALPKSDNSREALAKLMKGWIGGANVYHLADPVSAVKGVMAIQDMELRMEGLRLAAFEWSKSNSDLASKWIARQPAGPERDAAIEGLVNRLASADPDAATDWANSIEDEALRLKTVGRLMQKPSNNEEGSR